MTIKRVVKAAALRNIYFDGKKRWLNNMIGYGYEVLTYKGFYQADTLQGLYDFIMTFEKV